MKTSFKSAAMVAAAMASAMGCYTISLRASAERAGIDAARQRIARDTADIRLLQAELRTRARLPELQRWNEQVLALAAPRAEQLLANPVLLATYAAPPPAHAPVELAAVVRDAPAPIEPVRRVAFAVPRAGNDLSADAAMVGTVATDNVAGTFQKIALR
jgi:hypothetical protein